jgi:AraC-like DNA-binding protein
MNYQNTFQQLEPPSQTFLSCYAYTGSADSSWPKHCHSFYEISYIIKGTRYETLNQNKYKVESNSLFFIPPLSIHSLNNKTQVEDVVIQFDHLFIRNSSILFEKNYMLRPVEGQQNYINIKKSDNLYQMFFTIRDYCIKRDNLFLDDKLQRKEKILIDLKLNSLCLEVIFTLIVENKIYIDINGAAYSNIKEINSLINELVDHPQKTISMQEACRISGMSYSHFSRFFKKVTGLNYVNFCNLLRIRSAEELLLTTNMSISEIAEATGLKTIAYFTKLFKQINGNIPSNYRKKYHR